MMAAGSCPYMSRARKQQAAFKKESAFSMHQVSEAPATVAAKPMVGHYKLCQPENKPSLYITTIQGEGSERCKHRLKGLTQHSDYECDEWQWELALVNGEPVMSWAHCVLTDWLNQLRKEDTDISLILIDEKQTRQIEVIIRPDLTEDGSLGDKLREVYEVGVRMKQKLTPINIQHVNFYEEGKIRVRHGALQGHYLNGKEGKVCMDTKSNPPEHVFHCYRFSGREGAHGQAVFMCVLREMENEFYVQPCPNLSHKLRAVRALAPLDVTTKEIRTADPRFFQMISAGQGQETYFLRPLIYKDFWLWYDAVDKLKLQRCNEPGAHDTARNFTFEFIPDDKEKQAAAVAEPYPNEQ